MPGLAFLFLIGKNLDLFSLYVCFYFMSVSVFADMDVFILSVCLVLRGQKKASDLLELQLQTVVSSHEHRELNLSPLSRATNALNL